MLTHTYAWSRTQKLLIIAVIVGALTALVSYAHSYQRSHRLPDESILFGTWEMTIPATASSYTLLRLDLSDSGWHSGAWVRRNINDRDGREPEEGFSEMAWYAGGSLIYMHFVEEPPQIWQIVDIQPTKLQLRHAKQDYVFKRVRD